MNRSDCEALDRADPLAALREEFVLPEGVIYLDGNSLGPLPRAARKRLIEVADAEWGVGLIRSWSTAGWIDAPRRVGDKLARLVGARDGEVVVTDSTSINVFKLLVGALRLRPERRTILTEAGNFPTDLYMAETAVTLLDRGHRIHYAEGDAVAGAIDADTAVVMLTHVNYRTGWMHDMPGVTAAAHAAGALTLWDLAHSAGAVPVDLEAWGADLAVGCGYKYLNGGPGAPAFLYVRSDLQAGLPSTLGGWMGHAEPFAFERGYAPAPGITRHLCGTPPILALSALEAALDVWSGVDLPQVRKKSIALCDLFIALVEDACGGYGLKLVSPREPARRGSQVSFAHPEGYAIVQALIGRGVIGDFRTPDVMRFGFAPLYLRYADVWDAARALHDVLAARAWDRPEYRARAAVT